MMVRSWPASDRGRRPLPILLVSDFGLPRHVQGIINLNSEVSDGALELGMTEQQLNRSEILGSLVDQSSLGAVGSVLAGVQSDASTHDFTIRAYCRVEICGERVMRLGNRN